MQHAHGKGIIHRDLKPGNILVAPGETVPEAKVIDFGIAKAMSGRLTDQTIVTEQFMMIGTPAYMSPEQAEGSLDIDTRTDIYSLGVVLYELLTGSTPFDTKAVRAGSLGDLQRAIREFDPERPSTRVSKSGETVTAVAKGRGTDVKRLMARIRGELDWIALKALEKDRLRRYETANALAMDVRRYLAGDAVLAVPPTTAYKVAKFMRRQSFARILWRSGATGLEDGDVAGAIPELEEAVTTAEKLLDPGSPLLKKYRDTLAKAKALPGK